MSKKDPLVMVSIERLCAIDGSRMILSCVDREAWVEVVWGNVGRGESYPTAKIAIWELPAVLVSGVLRLIPTAEDAACLVDRDMRGDWEFISPVGFLQELVASGAVLDSSIPEPTPCPDDLLGPWEKEFVQPGRICQDCGREHVLDPRDLEGSACWTEGCGKWPCKGWSLLCCEHGMELGRSAAIIASRLRKH